MRRAEPAVDITRSTVHLPGRAEQKARAAAAPTAKREYNMVTVDVGMENDCELHVAQATTYKIMKNL